jgi:FKBP-type peptidyl-prolyl cis-trans isomerase
MFAYRKPAAVVAFAVLLFTACGEEEPATTTPAAPEAPECNQEPFETEDGVVIEDVECGDGAVAEDGMLLTVHYVGTLEDGTKFDSSRDRNEPFPFVLGVTSLIPGWELGMEGMKVGGVRKLTIPPELAYGEQGASGVIPPNATIHFEIELLEVSEPSPAPTS